MKVVYPIHIDRWSNPIASTLREIALRSPELQFFSFSGPVTNEDRELGSQFWSMPNVHQLSYDDLIRLPFDVVHHRTATWRNLAAVMFVKTRHRKCRHVFTISNHYLTSGGVHSRRTEAAIRGADVITAVSRASAVFVEERFRRRVAAVIPNGVDLAFFSVKAASMETVRRLGIDLPFALFVGAIAKRKHPEFVIELASRLPDVQFVMAGPVWDKPLFRQLEVLCSMRANVTYLGYLEKGHVRDLMASAACLLFPSEREGSPQTVLEAGAIGLPVLAQPLSSLPEVISEGETGWLLPREDVAGWADKLSRVLNWNATERASFRVTARAAVGERFSLDRVAASYREVYS